jgi:hypothetical protein
MKYFRQGVLVPGETFGTFMKKPIPIQAARIDEPFEVQTLEGTMTGNAGDYLLIGVLGELYPCKKEIFETTYQPVEETK